MEHSAAAQGGQPWGPHSPLQRSGSSLTHQAPLHNVKLARSSQQRLAPVRTSLPPARPLPLLPPQLDPQPLWTGSTHTVSHTAAPQQQLDMQLGASVVRVSQQPPPQQQPLPQQQPMPTHLQQPMSPILHRPQHLPQQAPPRPTDPRFQRSQQRVVDEWQIQNPGEIPSGLRGQQGAAVSPRGARYPVHWAERGDDLIPGLAPAPTVQPHGQQLPPPPLQPPGLPMPAADQWTSNNPAPTPAETPQSAPEVQQPAAARPAWTEMPRV